MWAGKIKHYFSVYFGCFNFIFMFFTHHLFICINLYFSFNNDSVNDALAIAILRIMLAIYVFIIL